MPHTRGATPTNPRELPSRQRRFLRYASSMASEKFNYPKTATLFIVSVDEGAHRVELQHVDFAAAGRSSERVFDFQDEASAHAFHRGATEALRLSGWVGESEGSRPGPAPSALPETFRPRGRFGRWLKSGDYQDFTGRYCPSSLVDVPLNFDQPDRLANELRSHSMLQDWLVRNPWPEGMVPLATLQPASEEDEERWTEANPSDTEQFYAVDVSQRPCPVFLWTADAGFEQTSDEFREFLDSLTQHPSEDRET